VDFVPALNKAPDNHRQIALNPTVGAVLPVDQRNLQEERSCVPFWSPMCH